MIKKTSSGLKVYSTRKKNKMRDTLKNYINEDGSRKETKIEAKLREILQQEGIYFVQEKYLQWNGVWKCFDFLCGDGIQYLFLGEADGEFWHSKESKGKIQKKNVKNDAFKDKMAKHLGIPLLRFTGKQILYETENVRKTILEEIERQRPK